MNREVANKLNNIFNFDNGNVKRGKVYNQFLKKKHKKCYNRIYIVRKENYNCYLKKLSPLKYHLSKFKE